MGFDDVEVGCDNKSGDGGSDGGVDDEDVGDDGDDGVNDVEDVVYDDEDWDDDDTLTLDDDEIDPCRRGSKHNTSLRIFLVRTSITNSWKNLRYANVFPCCAIFGTTPTISATVVLGMLPLYPDQQVSTVRSFTQRVSMASRAYCLRIARGPVYTCPPPPPYALVYENRAARSYLW